MLKVPFELGLFVLLSVLLHGEHTGGERESGAEPHEPLADALVVGHEPKAVLGGLVHFVEPLVLALLPVADVSFVGIIGRSVALLHVKGHDQADEGSELENLGGAVEQLVLVTSIVSGKGVPGPNEEAPSVDTDVPEGGVGPGADLRSLESPFSVNLAGVANTFGESRGVSVNGSGVGGVHGNAVDEQKAHVHSVEQIRGVDLHEVGGRGLKLLSLAGVQLLGKITHPFINYKN